jgi:hypothetical protein
MLIIKIAIVWLLCILTFGVLGWFYLLMFRSARSESKTVNQLWHVLSDEEIQKKIHRLDKSAVKPLD